MGTIKQTEFDNFVSHTIRIELKNGKTLLYPVSVEVKSSFYDLLKYDTISDDNLDFLWFHTPNERFVFLNKKEVIRITFCYDPFQANRIYHDNFSIPYKLEEHVQIGTEPTEHELEMALPALEFLPQLIIIHNCKKEVDQLPRQEITESERYFENTSTYSSMERGDFQGFDFDYIETEDRWLLLTFKYLEFIDDDGEKNFMPLDNISVIEVDRKIFIHDNVFESYLEGQPRKMRKPSKTKKND